ncbi:MAG: S8 family serine peptidase [Candidatus Eremiobacteraeota bacterium]|nr:S8 family serine peptidase [Candidatus Eremiobacteraeota bacterium]
MLGLPVPHRAVPRRLALLAGAWLLPVLAACGGGGRALPSPPPPPTGGSLPGAAGLVRTTAVRGVEVAVHLPLRNVAELEALVERQSRDGSPDYGRFLSPAQFRARYGPSAADLAAAARTLETLGFRTEVSSQTVLAEAPQPVVERAFNVHVRSVLARGGATLGFDRAATLPSALTRLGATVALSAHARHVHAKRLSAQPFAPDNRYGPVGPYWFTDLKQAYEYPSYRFARGDGRTIAIVIDSNVLDSDLALYFGHEHLAPPAVERRPVDGGPAPYDPSSASAGEASLDVEQAAGSAPGAHVMLYGLPDLSDPSVYDGYLAAVEDNRADIVSSSFGICELYYTPAYNGGVDATSILQQFHDLFLQANAQGITFVASSGDNGAYDCLDPSGSTYVKGVENPADDPNVTGLGGTNLVTAFVPGSRTSAYVRENAHYDRYDPAQGALPNEIFGSGGGESIVFRKPPFQLLVRTGSGSRTVPDLAMHSGGCPLGAVMPCPIDRSGAVVAVGGNFYEYVGTSLAAPEFAGLLAITEGRLGSRLGNANYYVYALARLFGSSVYHDNIPGSNGAYVSGPGYNLVVGNGTPRGKYFALEWFVPSAGVPWSPSNP